MAYYYHNKASNQGIAISGLSGLVAYTIQFYEAPVYGSYFLIDARRTSGSGFLQCRSGTTVVANTSTTPYLINGTPSGVQAIRDALSGNTFLADDSFTMGFASGGSDASLFFDRLNANGPQDLKIKSIAISDDNGTRELIFPSSGTSITDPLGILSILVINPPSDGSQWVPYDDGGTANQSTVSYDLGAIGFAVSSQITVPAIAASVGYDVGVIGYAIAAQQLAPGNNASLSYDIRAISYAVSAQQSAPLFSASVGYEIGAIWFAVQANTGIPANAATAAYDLGGIGYSVSAQSAAPQLSASLAYDIGGINYAISANTGAPIRAATVSYDIGGISWQADAQWQPSDALAIIGYDIGSVGFLVQARSGDVVVSSASDAGLSFKELARGLSFKEQPRGIKFTEPQRGVRV